ncbi:hypothetical protein C7999DRAFT_29697 [Corynascus novoguineensis]|uniref:Heterokaryon incompatibility domain-containing protein n=1 Tax=Corynascus novoguineensis TaxID=1126955 RepID=A0AAN7HSE5_9PEZI|nr:hypothetical protein C7999DRAFT_29697 [Corynascus novoguineensis]
MEEKQQQVRNMDRIYQAARKVCVWLGASSPWTDRAMGVIPKLLETIWDGPRKLQDRDWISFGRLLRNDWFSRRWVVQEIALAKEATVYSGEEQVSWTDLSDAISLWQSQMVNTLLYGSDLSDSPGLGASTLSFLSVNALRKDGQGNILGRRWNVEDLLALLPMFQAKVPHDALFAVLSMASDTPAFLPVDYSMPHVKLFVNVFVQIAKSAKSLDMMFRPWAPDTPGDRLPSFIAPLSRYSHIRNARGKYERRNADSLVGSPRRRIYAATPYATATPVLLTLPARVHNPELWIDYLIPKDLWFRLRSLCTDDEEAGLTLAAGGVRCAHITEVSEVCSSNTVPESWRKRWRESRPMPDLWRVVVAGRSHDGTSAPNWYRRVFESVIMGEPDGNRFPHRPASVKQSSDMTNYLRRVRACIWGRRFLISTRAKQGYFGLVPKEAKTGDMICLIKGCSVPVVFRGKPMTELLLQALQRAVLEAENLGLEKALAPKDREFLVSLLEDVWRQSLTERFNGARRLGGKRLTVGEKMNILKPLEEHGTRGSLEAALTDWAHSTLDLLPEQEKDTMVLPALETFFLGLMAVLVKGPADVVLAPGCPARNPLWADGVVHRLFQPLFAQACGRALKKIWTAEFESVYMFFHPDRFPSHEQRFQAMMEKVEAWASAGSLEAELWSGKLGSWIWRQPLEDALKHWNEKCIGVKNAYGGEVIGECYVQGLMEGEWWDSERAEEQESEVFIIA